MLVPRADEHQGEYVAALGRAAEMADGLLRLGRACRRGPRRRRRCSSTAAISRRRRPRSTRASSRCCRSPMPSSTTGSASICKAGAVVGFDPWLHTAAMVEELARRWSPRASSSRRCPGTPSTASGAASARRRRRAPSSPTRRKYAGKPAEQKIAELQAALRKEGEDAVDPDAAGFHRLAAQHPRLGRGAQSGGAGVRDRAGQRQAGALHRPGQGRARRPRRHLAKLAKISAPDALEERLRR